MQPISPSATPFIVGIGGTSRAGSSTERALRIALDAAASKGARTYLLDGPFLARLPIYNPEQPSRNEDEAFLVDTVRKADALIIGTPGYHGSIAGLVKNAIDLLEETARDTRVYLDKMPVGLVVTAYGWQATGSTLGTLRSIVHAMRGWPTPLGVAINSLEAKFDDKGKCSEPKVNDQLAALADQLMWFLGSRP